MKEHIALYPEEILIPKVKDMSLWSVIACDQFTSNFEYWDKLSELVKGNPTTLDLVLPEIYLNDSDVDERITKINFNMQDYYKRGIFSELKKGFILTVRKTPYVEKRVGLIGKIDLEEYEFSDKSNAIIRSTEDTIKERIPPRLKIREKAILEFPHVMLLMDDERREIIEKIYENRNNLNKIYDFELNMGGGHIEGYFVSDYQSVLDDVSRLLEPDRLNLKYGREDRFLFAVGDGNHSLATAKTHWENVKKGLTTEERKEHPARFALVEIVNIYDEGIYFEPIYRYVKGVDRQKFIKGLSKINGGNIKIVADTITEKNGTNILPDGIREVDKYIKAFLSENGGEVDYIHGEKNLLNLVEKRNDTVGIIFEKLDKKDLFTFVSKNGSFPKKTFSMGMGEEKRYYLEGRRIAKC